MRAERLLVTTTLVLALALAACGSGAGDDPSIPGVDGEPGVARSAELLGGGEGGLTIVFTNNIDGEIEPCG